MINTPKNLLPGLLLLLAISINSCRSDDCPSDDPNCPKTFKTYVDKSPGSTSCDPTPYDFELSPQFASIEPLLDNTPDYNPTTEEGAELGRFLFYDVRLSKNNTISCASCHQQEKGFSDPEQFSVGFENGKTPRHSMTLANLRWSRPFFWDGRVNTLEEQVLMPIQDPIEMGMDLNDLVDKLKGISIYPPMFEDAFCSPDITVDRVSMALSQFIRTLVSQNSRYDEVYINSKDPGKVKDLLTEEEYLGYKLFITHVDPDNGTGKNIPGSSSRGANCGDCHTTVLMTDGDITNNGLDSFTKDEGYGGVTGRASHMSTFKTPTLRNIELTAPYMHDGRFATLEEVMEHYDTHVQDHENLDPQISEAGNYWAGRLDLTQEEKAAIIAFMRTLTDNTFVTDTKFSDPFK